MNPRVDEFHRGIYWDEFAAQHEPLETWHAALRGEKPYELTIDLAMDGDRIVGGICIERYPRSNCGLLTYIVVAPDQRGRGIGRRLQTSAVERLYARGVSLVLGELDDPRGGTDPIKWERVRRNQRWGAQVLDVRYIQPSLGSGRDRQLVLIALPPIPPIDAAVLRAFIAEFYEATEGGSPDPEIDIPDRIGVLAL